VQAKRIDPDESNVARMQGDDSPGCSPAAHERHRMCSARAGEPRSTPERACFTTRPDATLTCAAREVTLCSGNSHLAPDHPRAAVAVLDGVLSSPESEPTKVFSARISARACRGQ
jgi:hypothetical protein